MYYFVRLTKETTNFPKVKNQARYCFFAEALRRIRYPVNTVVMLFRKIKPV